MAAWPHRCLLAAASTSLDEAGCGEPEAKAALEAARPHVAAALLQLACGDEVLLTDKDELFDLFNLARTLGADACLKACGKAIGDAVDADEGKWPIKLCIAADDVMQHRSRLRELYSQGRFADVSLRAPAASAAGDDETETKELRVHRVVLAAASGYFAALWAGGFLEAANLEVDISGQSITHQNSQK